jgi:hypothetical protein
MVPSWVYWTKIAGPAQGTLSTARLLLLLLTGLAAGSYTFRLQVTDNAGAHGYGRCGGYGERRTAANNYSKYVKVTCMAT